jgi:hypothetical protein
MSRQRILFIQRAHSRLAPGLSRHRCHRVDGGSSNRRHWSCCHAFALMETAQTADGNGLGLQSTAPSRGVFTPLYARMDFLAG